MQLPGTLALPGRECSVFPLLICGGGKKKGIISACQHYPPNFCRNFNTLDSIERSSTQTKEDGKQAGKAGLLKHTVLFGALVCSLQLAPAAASHADEFVGHGVGSIIDAKTGSNYDSSKEKAPDSGKAYDAVYGGKTTEESGIGREAKGNKLTLGSKHIINDKGVIYGGYYKSGKVLKFTNTNTGIEVQVGAKDENDKDAKNVVTIAGTKFNGAASIYGGYASAPSAYGEITSAGSSVSASHSLKVSWNEVKLSKIEGVGSVSVYGGYAAYADADIKQTFAKANGSSEASVTYSLEALKNNVELSGVQAASVSVCGGFVENPADKISAKPRTYGSSSDSKASATHELKASENNVALSGVTATGKVSVYGGSASYAYANMQVCPWTYTNGQNSAATSTYSLEASGNEVRLSDDINAEEVSVIGGSAKNVNTANGIDIDAWAKAAGSTASSIYSLKTIKNIVELSGITAAGKVSVYGGFAENSSSFHDVDSVVLTTAEAAGSTASLTYSLEVSGNEVTLSNSKAASVSVYGGYAKNEFASDADTDYVNAEGANSTARSGHSLEVSRNVVELSNIEGSASVCGGYAENDVTFTTCQSVASSTVEVSATASASNNSVKLTNVDAIEVYGGRSSATIKNTQSLSAIASGVKFLGTADSSENKVELHGGSFTGDLYAGYSSAVVIPDKTDTGKCSFEGTAASATGNKLFLYAYQGASPRLDGAVLWGGFAEYKVNGETFEGTTTGNTLEFHEVRGMTAKNIKNFDTLTFTLPTMTAGEAVLTLTDDKGTDISGATVTVTNGIIDVKGSDGGEFKADDEIVLLTNANGLTKEKVTYTKEKFDGQPDAATRKILGRTGISLQYLLEIQETDKSIILKCTDKTKVETVLPQTKAIAEGSAAGLALAGEAANASIALAKAFTMQAGTITPFVHVQGSSVTYETGSSVHLNAVSLLAGLGTGLDTGFGNLSLGAFFEYGKGSYTTSNTFDNSSDINGDGSSWYMGGGILAKMDFLSTGPGHFYVEGSAHMGQLHNEYDSSDLQDAGGRIAKFDMDSPYYSLHGGLGYVWNITEGHDVDVYGKYIWTRVQGTDDTLATGDRFEFDDMDSSRVRFGARYTYKGNERFRPYAGVAYEHEYAGTCESTTFGHDVAAPSFEGDTGIGELGITMTPSKELPLSVNLGVQGYVGQKQGVSGSCMIKYEF